MEVVLEGADLLEDRQDTELVPQPGGVWRHVGSEKEVHVAAATVRTHSADLDPQVKKCYINLLCILLYKFCFFPFHLQFLRCFLEKLGSDGHTIHSLIIIHNTIEFETDLMSASSKLRAHVGSAVSFIKKDYAN